jgi:hypothetical protein
MYRFCNLVTRLNNCFNLLGRETSGLDCVPIEEEALTDLTRFAVTKPGSYT